LIHLPQVECCKPCPNVLRIHWPYLLKEESGAGKPLIPRRGQWLVNSWRSRLKLEGRHGDTVIKDLTSRRFLVGSVHSNMPKRRSPEKVKYSPVMIDDINLHKYTDERPNFIAQRNSQTFFQTYSDVDFNESPNQIVLAKTLPKVHTQCTCKIGPSVVCTQLRSKGRYLISY
jgi:hypothetical protein